MSALESKGDIAALPSEQAFMCYTFVIAVATGNRSSELAQIDRSSVSIHLGSHLRNVCGPSNILV